MSRRASSEEILDEVERNLTGKFNLSPEKASRRLNHMRSAFPNAVVKDYEDLIPAMTNDPKDRHVAAAAVRGGAALIVTANIRDFPPESLEQYDIEAVHPDDFLQDQFDLDPTVTVACLRQQRAAYTRPQFTFREFYLSLARTVPNFVSRAAPAENADWNPGDPMPLEMKSADEARQAFFPEGDPVPTNPLGAATLWWTAHRIPGENADIAFIGCYVLGMGFVVEPDEAKAWIAENPHNTEVLFPYLNGEDLNSRPDCSASRWVIDFNDWPESKAKEPPPLSSPS